MTKNDIMTLLYELVDELAPTYGIKDRERFVDALASIVSYEDPSWDPAAAGDNGHSIGLFQLHDAGQGTGMSVTQRSDPETNIRKAISYLGPIWASSETQGLDFDQTLQRMISEGQRPADPQLGFQRAKAALQAVGGSFGDVAGAAANVNIGGLQPAGQGAGSTDQDFIAWLKAHGFGSSYVQTYDGVETAADANGNPVPSWLGQAFIEDTMGTTSGQSPEDIAYTKAQTGRTLAETAQINQEVGGYAANVSLDEREQKRKEIETEISAGTLEWNKGVDKFNAWMNATSEARLRAETEMKQKEWQLPTKYFPGTEPGGMLARVAERYGLPWTPLEGQPVTPENTAEGVYNKWQKNMGAPLQAPAFPSDETLPRMGTGGVMPSGRPFIAAEEGRPELIQPTPRGTVVQPVMPAEKQFSFATTRKPGEPGSINAAPGSLNPLRNWTGRTFTGEGDMANPFATPTVVGGGQVMPGQLYIPSPGGWQLVPAPTAAHGHVYVLLQRSRARRAAGNGQSWSDQHGQRGREV